MSRAGFAALTAAALVALAFAAPAAAQPSPRWGSAQVGVGLYKPSIDKSVPGGATPWNDIFGNSKGTEFTLDVARSVFTGYGSLDLGLGGGYFWKNGQGFASTKDTNGNPIPNPSSRQGDTTFHDVPLRLSVTYRFDVPVEQWGVPLAPYVRVAFERHYWWVTNSTGTSSYTDPTTKAVREGSGATNGMSFTAGMAFLLDFFDPTLAREMDRDSGINHTYLFADVTKDWIDNFGSATSWDLSNDGLKFSFGLLFVM